MNAGRCNRSPRAFSLIELIAIVAVLGVLAVLVAPATWWMVATRAGTASRVVVQDLTRARELAMNSGTPSWVVFDVVNERYSLLSEDAASPGRAGARPTQDPVTGAAHVQVFGADEFAGVSLVAAAFDGSAEIGFDWLGRPLRTNGTQLGARGAVTLSDGFGCVLEPGTGAAWTTHP